MVEISSDESGKQMLVLDQTIMYPQGGGQPSDKGTINCPGANFRVDKVIFNDGIVYHTGETEQGEFVVGDKVKVEVDKDIRLINCKLHTAGHLIDSAMKAIDLSFRPTRGYHFPDSPYVEYDGMIELEERPVVMEKLNVVVGQLIQEGGEVTTRIVEREQLADFCDYVPDYVPVDKPSRVVTVAGLGCPCGGTHVKDISELGKLNVTKIKVKGGNIRIGYALEPI